MPLSSTLRKFSSRFRNKSHQHSVTAHRPPSLCLFCVGHKQSPVWEEMGSDVRVRAAEREAAPPAQSEPGRGADFDGFASRQLLLLLFR